MTKEQLADHVSAAAATGAEIPDGWNALAGLRLWPAMEFEALMDHGGVRPMLNSNTAFIVGPGTVVAWRMYQ